MTMQPLSSLAVAALLAGTMAACQAPEDKTSQPTIAASDAAVAEPSPIPAPAAPVPSPISTAPAAEPDGLDPALVKAHAIAIAQWRKAENRKQCAPLGFASTGDAKAVPRRATFSGGWAVAFDQPKRRSAFGVAGPGLIDLDNAEADEQRDRLQRQWPYYREIAQLPRPSFAGYGIEGAQPYSDDNPSGLGQNSLAYARVAGQTCTYNVWSRLGRHHLELLLDNLMVLEPE